MINIEQLESLKNDTFLSLHKDATDDDITIVNNFLYHGIKNPNSIKKLENIFKTRKILSAKYLKEYYETYNHNANDEEYISLLGTDDKEFNFDYYYNCYIKNNITLIVSSKINAKKTIYLDYIDWINLKEYNNLLNRYSYIPFEYQVKDFIPFEYVVGIGFPYKHLIDIDMINCYKKLEDVILLMDKYDIALPIIDTSNNNVIIDNSKVKIKKLIN